MYNLPFAAAVGADNLQGLDTLPPEAICVRGFKVGSGRDKAEHGTTSSYSIIIVAPA